MGRFWRTYGTPPRANDKSWKRKTGNSKAEGEWRGVGGIPGWAGRWPGVRYRERPVQIDTTTETAEIVREIVIPESAGQATNYMAVMPGGKKTPTKLVSHWWGASFYQDICCIFQDAVSGFDVTEWEIDECT